MTAIFPHIFQEKIRNYPSVRIPFSLFSTVKKRKDAADSLTDKGSPGHTGDAHMEEGYEPDIHQDIGSGRSRKENKGRSGISHGREDPGGNVVEEHKGKSPYVNIEIKPGIRKYPGRGPDQMQKASAENQSARHENQAEGPAGDHGSGNRTFQFFVLPGSEHGRHHDGTAYIAAKAKGYKNQGDLVAVAHCGKGLLSYESAGHQGVCDIVKLLKDDTAK